MRQVTRFELGTDEELERAFTQMAQQGFDIDVNQPLVIPFPLRPVVRADAKTGPAPRPITLVKPNPPDSAIDAARKTNDPKPGFFDSLAQLTGFIGGNESIFSELISSPEKVGFEDLFKDPGKIEGFLESQAWSAANGLIKQEESVAVKDLTERFLSWAFGDASSAGEQLMTKFPKPGLLSDPVGWVKEKLDNFLSWNNLATTGVGEILDLAGSTLLSELGLGQPDDTASAGKQIASAAATDFLLPELKAYLKSQILGLLKDQFPNTFEGLGVEPTNIEGRIKEALGLEGDAGCVPIAICFDQATHKGTIAGPCAATVFAGEIPVARMGDGFGCAQDAVSAPIVEGIPSVLVEGKPIAPHEAATACGAAIQASGWHRVLVADIHPFVMLPVNDSVSSPAAPPDLSAPNGSGGPAESGGQPDAPAESPATSESKDGARVEGETPEEDADSESFDPQKKAAEIRDDIDAADNFHGVAGEGVDMVSDEKIDELKTERAQLEEQIERGEGNVESLKAKAEALDQRINDVQNERIFEAYTGEPRNQSYLQDLAADQDSLRADKEQVEDARTTEEGLVRGAQEEESALAGQMERVQRLKNLFEDAGHYLTAAGAGAAFAEGWFDPNAQSTLGRIGMGLKYGAANLAANLTPLNLPNFVTGGGAEAIILHFEGTDTKVTELAGKYASGHFGDQTPFVFDLGRQVLGSTLGPAAQAISVTTTSVMQGNFTKDSNAGLQVLKDTPVVGSVVSAISNSTVYVTSGQLTVDLNAGYQMLTSAPSRLFGSDDNSPRPKVRVKSVQEFLRRS